MRLASPEHNDAQDAKAFAYVRPHDLDVQRYTPGASGIVVTLTRAIVIGPIARLELNRVDATHDKDAELVEAQIPAQQFRDLDLREGETLVLTPRAARVFVEA